MPIPQRYVDRRATPVSGRVCDVALERLARQANVQPIPRTLTGIVFHDIGPRRYRLRAFATSMAGEVWTNIGRKHPEKVRDANAFYLFIAYSLEHPDQLTLYELSPTIIISHYSDADIPLGNGEQWSVRIKRDDDGHVVLLRSGAQPVVLQPGDDHNVQIWQLEEEESEAIRNALAQPEAAEGEAGENMEGEIDETESNPLIAILGQTLSHTRQVILQGPPGTGKSWLARDFLRRLVEDRAGGGGKLESYQWTVIQNTRTELTENNSLLSWDIVQFHPSYSYDDFVRGMRAKPIRGGQTISFEYEDRIFASLCKVAQSEWDAKDRKAEAARRVYLIIDEINRGDPARIFGELIYGLEDDKRGHSISTPSGPLAIPRNLYLIGTMNTADKTIAITDYALRRRFAFIDLEPKQSVIESFYGDADESRPVKEEALRLFKVCQDAIPDDGRRDDGTRRRHYAIGHSFFMAQQDGRRLTGMAGLDFLRFQLQHKILPLLREYKEDGIRIDPEPLARLETWVWPDAGSNDAE